MLAVLLLAGCAQAATPTIPSGEVDTTEEAGLLPTDAPTPITTPTPGPSPTPTLPDVPPIQCAGTFAYVLTTTQGSELHVVDACDAISLSLPDDAGPALDIWVNCQADAQPPSLAWSPDGARLVYVSDYGGVGHGELHLLAKGSSVPAVLTPSYALLDAASGKIVKTGCTDPAQCHPALIQGGQVTFINSRNPHWSPDSKQIGFDSMGFDAASSNAPVYRHFVMNADGTAIRALSDADAAALDQTWKQNMPIGHNTPKFNAQVTGTGVTLGCVAWHE